MATTANQCFQKKANSGVVSKQVARIISQKMPNLPLSVAIPKAKQLIARQKKQKVLQALKMSQARKLVFSHPKGSYAGLNGLLSHDRWAHTQGGNLEALMDAEVNLAMTKFMAGIDVLSPKFGPLFVDQQRTKNFIDEVFSPGSSADSAAKEAADQWRDVVEYLRKTANDKGAEIRELSDWLFPQHHNKLAIAKRKRDGWRDFVKPRIDHSRLRYQNGNQVPASKVDDYINNIYDAIVSDGASSRPVKGSGNPGQSKSLANRLSDSKRSLHFKDAQSWTEYNNEFGSPDTYNMLVGHIETMARDIAMMDLLGPNPEGAFKQLLAEATAQTRLDALSINKNKKNSGLGHETWQKLLYQPEALWNNLTGKYETTGQGLGTGFANVMQGTRNSLTAAYLGRAFVTAFVDEPPRVIRSGAINDLPASKLVSQYVGLFKPGSRDDRLIASQMGYLSEDLIARAATSRRYDDMGNVRGVTSIVADLSLRSTALTRHTDAFRQSVPLVASGELALRAGSDFSSLSRGHQLILEQAGIDAAKWDTIRGTVQKSFNGTPIFDASEIAKVDRDLAVQFLQSLNQVRDRSVLTASSQGKAVLTVGSDLTRGTVTGELMRSASMFKSFGVAQILREMENAQLAAKNKGSVWGYIATVFITQTIIGGLAVQLRAISKGQDPHDMNDPAFLGRAVTTGGGLTILGDTVHALFEASSRQSTFRGVDDVMFGPVYGFGKASGRLITSNISQAAQREDTNIGRELVRFGRRNLPGSSHWLVGTAIDRILWDSAQEMMDPNYRKSFNRREQFAKEQGSGFYWRPGESTPDRAPDLANAFGGSN